ncbi:beta-lactamase/transpeptidase-like protein [Infundibulicybe gibba]|nr:beta-lactamase/transpeptidase-like protein [Infundibulicybe gibba]
MVYLRQLTSRLPLYFLYGFILTASAQGSPNAILDAEMETFVNQVLTGWGSPGGVAIAVVRISSQGGWNVETRGYGAAKADGTKVNERTLFSIGSNSKVMDPTHNFLLQFPDIYNQLFSTVATGLLIHNETLSPRVSWNSRVGTLIPEWSLMDPLASNRSTIIDLMSHRTGLPRHDLSYGVSDDIQTVLSKTKYLRPSAEFREVFQYNNIMYAIISHLPTALLPSKIPFARYVKANIFDPLGLTSTTYSFDVATATGNLADGMSRQRTPVEIRANPFGPGIPRPLPYFSQLGGEDGNAMSGAGGVISNAIDMAKLLQTLLLDGTNPMNNVSIIPPQVIEMVSTGITVESGTALFPELSPVVYGGGQERSTYRGHQLVEHGGATPGFNTLISRLPDDGLGVAVLTNDDVYGGLFMQVIKAQIFDRALGLTKIDWDASTFIGSRSPRPLRSTNATLPSVGSFASLAGNYTNPGYQTIELCVVANPGSNGTTRSSSSQSCKNLAAEAPHTLPGAVDANIPTLLAHIDSDWASHLMLTHWNGNVFNITALQSVPTGNASEPFWMYVATNQGVGEFARDSPAGRVGLGVTSVWGAGEGVPSLMGNTVREKAEVWFDGV